MAHGSPILTIRIPAELLGLVDEAVARSVDTRRDGPWTRSSLVQKAIEDFLKKMARSSGKPSPLPANYRRDSSTY
jgi:metal-responsive CopG/Arc/MetJ family transcriptional regulator